jgi:hypothetical protein
MKRFLSLTLCLAMVTAASMAFAATSGTANGDNGERLHQAVPGYPQGILHSNSSSLVAARETAGPDTFALYGGPDQPIEGKFNLANGVTPDWGDGSGDAEYSGAPGQWRPVDTTQNLPFWHVDTFNAANLNNNGAGNKAMWSGLDSSDLRTETWKTAPGYGNGWNDILLFESAPVADASVGQTVDLDFYFNFELELNWDFFFVEYDSAGTWTQVMGVTGSSQDTNLVFQAPGLLFSDVSTTPIVYSGNDYGGDDADRIRVRLLVSTDGAWSDEDGSNPTTAGAVQVDDISISSSVDITTTLNEGFEGAAPYLFDAVQAPFVGDFAAIWGQMSDLDPCRDNLTPIAAMFDAGQTIRNGPGIGGETSIVGGSTSTGVNYGIPGNYVVNYTGGLSFGELMVRNEIWSPLVAWDYPGTADDDPAVAGAWVRFSVWMHLLSDNGIYFIWHVRSNQAGDVLTPWQNRNTVWYGDFRSWINYVFDISDMLVPNPENIQLAMATWDYSIPFGKPGDAATPSPAFDNIALYKYRIGGVSMTRDPWDPPNDGFPRSGSIDVSTQAARDGLDIAFDMANDIDGGTTFLDTGDSTTVDASSTIPGADMTDLRMFWALNTNPLFEDAIRSAPARAKDLNVVAGAAGTIWTGEVVADTCKASNGAVIEGRYFFDLPDVDLIYPGDVLQYYYQATDSDGRITTLPANLNGFGDFSQTTLYARFATIRGLPSISDDTGTQPEILVWNDFGHRGAENVTNGAFAQLGYVEGVDYDTYTTQAPSSGISNGLGAAAGHGANADQIAGYHHMFYHAGNLNAYLFSDGSGTGANDKADDVGLLEQWHALPGARNVAYFGEEIATGIIGIGAAGIGYLSSTMGVEYGDRDVADVIGGQTAPVIVPNAASSYAGSFSTSFVAYGGCLVINRFDQIGPDGSAEAGHLFTAADGTPYAPTGNAATGGVGSVINPTANGLEITIPFDLRTIQNQQRVVGLSARSLLFQEILGLFSAPTGPAPAVPASPGRLPAELSVYPNPFNPQTTVKFANVGGMKGSVKVFNLRGELVRTLHSGEFTTDTFTWDGSDNRGASVASGVYVIQAQAGGDVLTKKAALVK